MASLVDFHTHFFSHVYFQTLGKASTLEGSIEARIERVARTAGVDVPSTDLNEHLARWQQEMDTHGVGHMVSIASVPEEGPVLADAAVLAEGRLSPFLVVDPTAEGAARRLETALTSHGFRGAVFFPALHRFDFDSPEARASFEVLEREGRCAMVHCGVLQMKLRDLFGLPHKHDLTLADPLRLVPVAADFPELPFVIPHFGAGFLRETLMAGTQVSNLYVDTSSSHGWVDTQPERLELADVFERALRVFGPLRVLFGTDSSVFPRGWRRDLFLAQREALGACGVSDEDRERIFGGNARRLLRVEADSPTEAAPPSPVEAPRQHG